MRAVVSGSAGRAVMWGVHEAQVIFPTVAERAPQPCALDGAARLLAGSNDWTILDDVSREDIQAELDAAHAGVQLLQLTLLLADETTHADTVRLAFDDVELVAGRKSAIERAENILLAHPMGAPLNAATSVRRYLDAQREPPAYLVRLRAWQPAVETLRAAFERELSSLRQTSAEETVLRAEAHLMKSGIWREAVARLAESPLDHVARSLAAELARECRQRVQLESSSASESRAELSASAPLTAEGHVVEAHGAERLNWATKIALWAALAEPIAAGLVGPFLPLLLRDLLGLSPVVAWALAPLSTVGFLAHRFVYAGAIRIGVPLTAAFALLASAVSFFGFGLLVHSRALLVSTIAFALINGGIGAGPLVWTFYLHVTKSSKSANRASLGFVPGALLGVLLLVPSSWTPAALLCLAAAIRLCGGLALLFTAPRVRELSWRPHDRHRGESAAVVSSVLTENSFLPAVACVAVSSAAVGGYMVALPFYAFDVARLGLLGVGLAFIGASLVRIPRLGDWLLARVATRPACSVGLCLSLSGFLLMASPWRSYVLTVSLSSALVGQGHAVVFVALFAAVPSHRRAILAAWSSVGFLMGGATTAWLHELLSPAFLALGGTGLVGLAGLATALVRSDSGRGGGKQSDAVEAGSEWSGWGPPLLGPAFRS